MYRYGLLLSQLRTILDISISIERNMPVAEQVIQTWLENMEARHFNEQMTVVVVVRGIHKPVDSWMLNITIIPWLKKAS